MTSITARMLESCGKMLDLDVRERPHYRSLQTPDMGLITGVSANSVAAIAQCIALCARDSTQASFNVLMGDLSMLRLDIFHEQKIVVAY
jgi:hypothetical protein